MNVAYITENRFGNYVPNLSTLVLDGNGEAVLVPEACAMACIKLEDAQRTVTNFAPAGSYLFTNPIADPTKMELLRLAVLVKANGGVVPPLST